MMHSVLRNGLLLLALTCLLNACGGGGASNDESDNIRRKLPSSFDMQTQTILAPGQSGFISADGELQGKATGNPSDYGEHVDDQRIPYWSSEFKPAAFFDIANQTPAMTPREGVQIYRDDYGVPVVYGETEADVWFGAGYAVAVDRLFLLDGIRRTGRGTLSELTGPGDVPADIQTRILTYSEAEYASIFEGLSERSKNVVTAYRDGVNARIAEVNADPSLLPIEYVLLTSQPQAFSVADLFACSVLITRTVAAWGGDEMKNVVALRELEAMHGKVLGRKIFRDTLWVDDRKAAVTVTDRDYSNITTPKSRRAQVFEAMADYAASLPLELQHGPGTGHAPEPVPVVGKLPEGFKWPADPHLIAKLVRESPRMPDHIQASYHAVIGPSRTADGSTLLVNGPQVGYNYPTQLAEMEVHGAGYNARGAVVPGLPVIAIGHTDKTAWALTTGESKTIDSFIVTLADGEPNKYLHNGQTRTMECRDEVVRFRAVDPAAGAPFGPPEFSVTEEVCRTVYGPVVARSADGKLARSVQYAMWLREIESADAWLQWNRTDNFDSFHEGMKLATLNENIMYIDAAGNIAFYHPGLHADRHPDGDMRLPLPGDGSVDHRGLMDFDDLPRSINPAKGWLANWNNKPALGWGEGVGGEGDSLPAGPEARVTIWDDLLSARKDFTYDDLAELDKRIGRIDPRARAFKPLFLSISGDPGLTGKQQALLDIVASWDGDHYNPDIDITDPAALDRPGETIFDVLMKSLVDKLFKDVMPTAWFDDLAYHGRHPHDAKRLENLALKLFRPGVSSIRPQHDFLEGRAPDSVLRDVVAEALTRLEATYGAEADPLTYQRVHPRDSVCSLTGGVTGPCLDMPHQDRGSWIQLIGFRPN